MKRRINVSPEADADMIGIWRYTAREHGPEAANRYIADLDQAMGTALEFPGIGADCSEVRRGYRRIRSGSHLIFYLAHGGGIEVVRVLHERMDFEERLR